jgi:hypothetical protein
VSHTLIGLALQQDVADGSWFQTFPQVRCMWSGQVLSVDKDTFSTETPIAPCVSHARFLFGAADPLQIDCVEEDSGGNEITSR